MLLQHLCSPHSHTFVRYIMVLHKPQYKLLFYLMYFLCLELKHGVLMQLDTNLCDGNTEQLPKCLCVRIEGAGHGCK